ncbi:hypothetical protein OESDEN_00183 [Oesophagostomum dentatum]|uniref:Uncharacterized protein n=1 Tax=Oesophagostomum dentatum TaxID=61180 RepID=A0A0B1TRD9_OESDE|nr:hypothetical protein OESDEN_00183 [Oesophagostomum dentatum]
MDPRTFQWVSPYPHSSELLREHQRPTVLQHTQFDHFESASGSSFFSPLSITSGFPFQELDYRIHDGTSMIHPTPSVAEPAADPTSMETAEMPKDIPELKTFSLHTPRRYAQKISSAIALPEFQYHLIESLLHK